MFAVEVNEWGAAGIASGIIAVLGGVGVLIERYYKVKRKYDKDSIVDKRKEDNAIVKEYKELAAKLKEDNQQNREEIHQLRNDMVKLSAELALCRIGRARADERIAALEQALDDEGIKYRKWSPESSSVSDSSGDHAPVKAQAQPPAQQPPATRAGPKSGKIPKSPTEGV